MPNYGRHSSEAHIDFGFIAPGQLRGVTFNATSQHLWAYQLGIWGGRYTTESTSNVSTRIGVYSVDASLNPSDRIGYSGLMSITATMNDWTGGASNVAAISASDGPVNTSIPLQSGTRYHLAVLGTVGYLGHAMQAAARITADNEKFYNRSGLSQPPPDPFGSYTSSTEGHLTIWAVCDANVAPETPSSLSPSGTINDTAPTFSAAFQDQNAGHAGGTDRGDYLTQYKIQVRRQSDGASFWNTTITASSAEQAADAISRAYGGTTLVRGTTYEWRCQMADYFGAWSWWTSWTAFTPANLGFVTNKPNPTGTIQAIQTGFEGYWTHQSSSTMTKAQVRLLNSSGTVLQTSGELGFSIASSAAPGTLFTITWASTGMSDLAWGASYQYQIKGYDGSQWSDWSAATAFSTNAAPTVPSGLSPANSLPVTSYPKLTCTATDADDDSSTGMTVSARIKDSGGTVLSTVAMTETSTGSGVWEYQTDASDLASYDTYKWDAYSYDGTIYSGEQTTASAATKSSEATFVYAEGPTVTVTSPTDGATITTSNLPVTWTVTDQQKYRVYLYADGTTTAVYDSGETVSTTSSHTIPTGYLRNDTSYDLIVWVEDSNPLTGTSAITNITVDYVEPDTPANFQATTTSITTDLWDSAIRLTWDQTAYGTSDWQEYTISRTAASGPDTSEIILARITSPTQTAYVDYTPASGIEYTYSITQTIQTGLDSLTSATSSAAATVDLGGVVLVSVSSPTTLRTALRHTAERDYPRTIDEAVYQPVSGAKPTTVRSLTRYVEPSFDVQVFDDDQATAAQRLAELIAIDEDGGTYCYRDNHGRKYFVTVPVVTPTDKVPDWYLVRLEFRQVKYAEGVE